MVLPQPKPSYTVEEYLELERQAEERHEYIDGEIYEMAGESLAHSQLCTNVSRIISTQLLGKPCQVLSPNMKVRSGPSIRRQRATKGMFSYADLTVVCGEPRFHDEFQDVLLNPTVIVEVLSPSTEDFDRGGKFYRYRTWSETLMEYVLVSQSQPLIELMQRQADGSWLLTQVEGLDGSIYLASIDCQVKLSEIYDRVSFLTPEMLLEQ